MHRDGVTNLSAVLASLAAVQHEDLDDALECARLARLTAGERAEAEALHVVGRLALNTGDAPAALELFAQCYAGAPSSELASDALRAIFSVRCDFNPDDFGGWSAKRWRRFIRAELELHRWLCRAVGGEGTHNSDHTVAQTPWMPLAREAAAARRRNNGE